MIYYYWYLFVKMKVFNYSKLHFAEVTFYKIPTLIIAFSITTKVHSFLKQCCAKSSVKTKIKVL